MIVLFIVVSNNKRRTDKSGRTDESGRTVVPNKLIKLFSSFNITLEKIRRIVKWALPSINIINSDRFEELVANLKAKDIFKDDFNVPICRLCATEMIGEPTTVASLETMNLAYKFLKIQMSLDDKRVPRTICKTCCSTLKNFQEFTQTCTLAQENWLNKFNVKFNFNPKTSKIIHGNQETPCQDTPCQKPVPTPVIKLIKSGPKVVIEKMEILGSGTPVEEDTVGLVIEEEDVPKAVVEEKSEFTVILQECEVCDSIFETQRELKDHIRSFHTIPSSRVSRLQGRVCPICRAVCKTITLAEHMYQEHPNEIPTCSICNRRYATPFILARHQDKAHRSSPCER